MEHGVDDTGKHSCHAFEQLCHQTLDLYHSPDSLKHFAVDGGHAPEYNSKVCNKNHCI